MLGGDGADTIGVSDGDNIVIGDNGFIDYVIDDSDSSDIDRIETTDPNHGGADHITTGAGFDLVLGGTAGDTVFAGAGNDLVFGDHGSLVGDVDATKLPLSDLPAAFTFTAIYTQTSHGGGNDLIHGEDGEDIILGQQGSDTVYGGAGNDDLIGGHNVADGHDAGDFLDGGSQHDVIVGDNASILRRGDRISPRFRTLTGTTIYGITPGVDDGQTLVDGAPRSNPNQVESRWIHIFNHSDTPLANTSGDDYIAGGAHDDVIFGQLGIDVIQGDGSIDLNPAVGASRLVDGTLHVDASVEADDDGDDYIEGGGGDDVIFGNLGQDDIVGGSSDLFDGLSGPEDLRPDGSDLIFGGAGTDLLRNNDGDLTEQGHARDADVIAGDNANILRLVGINGTPGGFRSFNYDTYDDNGAGLTIIPRAVELLDYTEGGPDFEPNKFDSTHPDYDPDNGSHDEIHGESGDDEVYGQAGDDVLFGEGQDDNLVGGWGREWISGGTGDDGVLGDDGRIYTSRNSDTIGEPLYGIGTVDTGLIISTPGKVQQATIHADGQLKKMVNLAPFNVDPNTGWQDPLYNPVDADDIIFGGLGHDSLHGGPGDDAISGAESLSLAAVRVFRDNDTADGQPDDGHMVVTGYDRPLVLSDIEQQLGVGPLHVLGYEELKAEEFAAYDEYDPRTRITVDGEEFLLNFDASEGDPVPGAGGIYSDGDDRIFGDLGNDWLVGGTGRDHIYGGYGNDLANADDDLDTSEIPDGPEASYEDIVYGGAGRDVMIGNTGGDRLIDWAGEFNSYIVPFAPLGLGTISRSLQPALMNYLYDLSASDGADPTRASDTGNAVARNGEPDGELGLVKQQDDGWQDQTGAPDDPQPGNIPGGARDVLRGANFNTGSSEGFFIDSGNWNVSSGRLEVSPQTSGGDAASVFHIEDSLPGYFEVRATVNGGKPIGSYKSNAYIIFDYQSATDFKYAGVNISNDKMEIGYRDATGWHELRQKNAKLKPNRDYNLLLALNGTVATLVVNGRDVFTHVFDARIGGDGYSWGLNAGMVGLGAKNSIARIDNMVVQVLPPEITLEDVEDFRDGVADLYTGDASGSWAINGSGDKARFEATPADDEELAYLTTSLKIGSAYLLQVEAVMQTDSFGGIIFDRYDADQFKFAALSADTGEVVIGHHTARGGWAIDASVNRDVTAGVEYELKATLKGSTVSLQLDGQIVLGHAFNAVTVDGDFGLMTRNGASSFNAVTLSTDDPAYLPTESGLFAAGLVPYRTSLPVLTDDDLTPIVAEAASRWVEATGDVGIASKLADLHYEITDLPSSLLGLTEAGTIRLDVNAAGRNWFVDRTPDDDVEFEPGGDPVEGVDLLTAVMHEMGHALGAEHIHDTDGLMYDVLQPGVRRSPGDDALAIQIDVSAHPGDANLDGYTDVRDFMIWNANKFTSGTNWEQGDFNSDGLTDVRDFMIWNANKFTSAPAPLSVDLVLTDMRRQESSHITEDLVEELSRLYKSTRARPSTDNDSLTEDAVDEVLLTYL